MPDSTNNTGIASNADATQQLCPDDLDDIASASAASDYPKRYRFESHIASGAMGSVDLVEDAAVGRTTAIKTILPTVRDPDLRARFEAEAKILGQLEHPNIVPLYDADLVDPDRTFFTMRYVRGQTLETIIERLRDGCQATLNTYTWARRAQLLQQTCDAIEYAHSRGIIHCDLKPANLMIGAFGELVVMDWGIAVQLPKEAHTTDTEPLQDVPSPTDTDKIIGSPAYLSPEVLTEQEVVGRSRDVFAIGTIMYEFLTLERPFQGDSIDETFTSVIHHKPTPLYQIRQPGQRTVPVELHHVCMKTLNKDPAERYQSCAEIRNELQLYLDGRFPVRCPSTALKRFSQKISHAIDDYPRTAVIGSILLIMVALAVGYRQLAS